MEQVFFNSKDGTRLEGLLNNSVKTTAAVITHPHPLYGGSMSNYVIDAVEAVFSRKAYATLRFNFRGVGKSAGRYARGSGEIGDVVGAMAYMREKGAKRIILAGYSFGAWVNAHVQKSMQPDEMVMISPPVAMMDFSDTGTLEPLKLVITGRNDEIAPPELIEKHLVLWNPEAVFAVIENEDHFYGASLADLKQQIDRNI